MLTLQHILPTVRLAVREPVVLSTCLVQPDDFLPVPSPNVEQIIVVDFGMTLQHTAGVIYSVLGETEDPTHAISVAIVVANHITAVIIEVLFGQPDNCIVFPVPYVIKLLVEDFGGANTTAVIRDTVQHKPSLGCDECVHVGGLSCGAGRSFGERGHG